jgi:hypothetical protein
MPRRSLCIVLGVVLAATTGCASSAHFRTSATPCQPRSYSYAPGLPGCTGLAYTFNLIEFNENGRLWDTAQLAAAESSITRLAGASKPLVLVIFIHGWHHNADLKDENIKSFESVLARTVKSVGESYDIMGIYLGWRGESTALWPEFLNNISFFNRRDAADRMANSVELADTLLRLGFDARNAYQHAYPAGSAEQGEPPQQPQVVLVGHSFGGRILERSIVPSLLASVRSTGAINRGKPFDLIVLLNPAHSALGTRDLIDTLRSAAYEERPFIVNITSTADSATGMIYPLAQLVNGNHGPFATFSGDDAALQSEKYLSTYTAGHLAPFQSHLAVPLPAGRKPEDFPFYFVGDGNGYVIEENRSPVPWNWSHGPADAASNFPTPYWVIKVGSDLVSSHGDVFNDKVEAMVTVLLERTMAGETSAKPYSERAPMAVVVPPPPLSAGSAPRAAVVPAGSPAAAAGTAGPGGTTGTGGTGGTTGITGTGGITGSGGITGTGGITGSGGTGGSVAARPAPGSPESAGGGAGPAQAPVGGSSGAPAAGGGLPEVTREAAPRFAQPPAVAEAAPSPQPPASPQPSARPQPSLAAPPPPPPPAVATAGEASASPGLTVFGIDRAVEVSLAPYARFELYGFRALLARDPREALKNFDLACERREDYHSVAAIRQILRGRGTFDEQLRQIAERGLGHVDPGVARLIRRAAGLGED